jgi:hypothetical protein
MEIIVSNKDYPNPFIFIKARRCGSNSLDAWLDDNVGKDNYVLIAGDNWCNNYSLFNIVEDDILAGTKVTFCRNPYSRLIASYHVDIWHMAQDFPANPSDLTHPIQPEPMNPDVPVDPGTYKITEDKDIHIENFTFFVDTLIEYHQRVDPTKSDSYVYTPNRYWWQNTSVTLPLFHTVLDNDKHNIQFFDHIIKQEEIATTFPTISNKILGKEVPLNKVNTFSYRHPYSKSDISYVLDHNNNREKIADCWSNDFECFGYDK